MITEKGRDRFSLEDDNVTEALLCLRTGDNLPPMVEKLISGLSDLLQKGGFPPKSQLAFYKKSLRPIYGGRFWEVVREYKTIKRQNSQA